MRHAAAGSSPSSLAYTVSVFRLILRKKPVVRLATAIIVSDEITVEQHFDGSLHCVYSLVILAKKCLHHHCPHLSLASYCHHHLLLLRSQLIQQCLIGKNVWSIVQSPSHGRRNILPTHSLLSQRDSISCLNIINVSSMNYNSLNSR